MRAHFWRAVVSLLSAASVVLVAGATAAQPDPIDHLLASLAPAEKVGQLLLAGFDGQQAAGAAIPIGELRAGGIVLLANASTADQARVLTAELQQLASASGVLPLLIAVDHEGGRVQRIRGGMTTFGPNRQLGNLPSETAVAAVCARGATHGRELASIGVQMNLAPVLDVWDNPLNTVIGERAFSDDPEVVARLGAAYVEALQHHGVLAVGKHFPGHGNSTEDSHLTLPIVRHQRARLEAVELRPFVAAGRAGVAALMTAHVSYPAIDPVVDRPASLSPAIVNGLLRGELGYDGLVLTDDLGAMAAITARYEPGEAAVQAVESGSDMLVVVGPAWRQRRMVEALLAEIGQRISPERLDASVRRVLRAKQAAGLFGDAPRSAALSGDCERRT